MLTAHTSILEPTTFCHDANVFAQPKYGYTNSDGASPSYTIRALPCHSSTRVAYHIYHIEDLESRPPGGTICLQIRVWRTVVAATCRVAEFHTSMLCHARRTFMHHPPVRCLHIYTMLSRQPEPYSYVQTTTTSLNDSCELLSQATLLDRKNTILMLNVGSKPTPPCGTQGFWILV
jgi:hypothetical protein